MLKNIEIRLAEENDCRSILEIYTPYITDTVITFECQIPAFKEFKERMAVVQKKYPWFVCKIDGNIVGYAYASCFNEREAYDWSADFSIYIEPKYHGKNIGKALYYALAESLKLQGYFNAYAGITMPNIKSEALHESIGFKAIGVYQSVGYKFGSWHDVKWYGLKLNEYSKQPAKPKSIHEICKTDEFGKIIEITKQMISKGNI